MHSLTVIPHEQMPGYHFARIVVASLQIADVTVANQVVESARALLQRGDS